MEKDEVSISAVNVKSRINGECRSVSPPKDRAGGGSAEKEELRLNGWTRF